MAFTTGDNNFGTAKWIVDATAGQGTHTTIAAALTAASSGQDIFIRPGTYTENLTLKAGVNLLAFSGDDDTPNVTIVGKCSFSSAGTVSISNIRLKTNSDFCLSVTGSAASIVNLFSCTIEASNNTAIQFTSSSGSAMIELFACNGLIDTTGITYFTHSSAGLLDFNYCQMANSGLSTTASTASAGQLNLRSTGIGIAIACSGTSVFSFGYSSISPKAYGVDVVCLTTSGTAQGQAIDCDFETNTSSAISVGAGTTLNIFGIATVYSTNTNAITGAGTLNYSAVNFTGSSSKINTTTIQNTNVSIPSISSSDGTQAVSVGSTGIVNFPVSVTLAGGTALSSYVAGTFTPVLNFGGGTTGITYGTQVGTYQRIGNIVFFRVNIVLTSKGSSTGSATITGFPINADASGTNIPVADYQGITFTASYTNLSIQMGSNTTATIVQVGSGQSIANIADTAFTNTAQFHFTGHYFV